MRLRKCPSCRDMVGADSVVCPRCGINFRAALRRKIIVRTLAGAALVWLVCHFIFKF